MATSSISIASRGTRAQNLIAICAKELKFEVLCLRLPMHSFSTLVLPLMFYVRFGPIMGKQAIGHVSATLYLIPSYGTFAVMGTSLFGTAANLAAERGLGWLQVKRASPMPIFPYFLAKVALGVLFKLTDVVVLLFMGVAFAGGATGLAIGYFARPNSAPAVINLFHLPMSFISGLWIPLMFLPKFIQHIAVFLPPYHLSQLALNLAGAGGGRTAAAHWHSFVGFSLISLGIAWAGHQRDEKANG